MHINHSKNFAMNWLRFRTKFDGGFTLIELLVALLVVAIVLAVAVPSFRDATRRNRLTTQVNDFVTALQFTRSEAIKRGVPVTFRSGWDYDANGVCDFNFSGDWDDGWEIFVDSNEDGIKEGACSNVLRIGDAFPGNYTLRYIHPPEFIFFHPNGRIEEAGSFVLCDDTDGNNIPESNTARRVVISGTGRIRIAEHGSNNIPLGSNGSEINSCL